MQRQVAVFLNFLKLHRRRRGNYLALIGLQFCQSRLHVWRNGEDQVFGRNVTIPVVRVGQIADL
ncbi:hypothetical protein D3C81_2337670 [compost metagenome]